MKPDSLANRLAGLFLAVGNKVTGTFGKTTHFQRTFRIEKPPAEVYAFWRDFHNFKKATRAADTIEVRNPHHARWVVRGPFGVTLMWNSEITVEDPERRIGWRTALPSDVPHVGQVVFQSVDEGRATEVALAVDYRMPLGPIGDLIAWVTRAGPSTFISEEIARVKLAIEGHRSRAADVAQRDNLIELAEGPPNPPVRVEPKKTGRSMKHRVDGTHGPGDTLFDRRQRLRTQH
ncbi:MAG: SRPBCC family protein [Myxococcota bacterium]